MYAVIATGGKQYSVEEGAVRADKGRRRVLLPRTLVFDEIDIGIGGRAAEAVGSKLQAIGFGFLIPIFFISTGVAFQLKGLLHHPAALALVPLFLLALLVVRGVPALFYVRAVGPAFGRGDMIAKHPKLAAYMASVAQHPAVAKVQAELGAALKTFMSGGGVT